MTYDQAAAEIKTVYGKGAYHATALYREIFEKGNGSLSRCPEFSATSALATRLKQAIVFPASRIAANQDGDGGVIKFATVLGDGATIETVIIPGRGRTTLCVSSQAGCAMGCAMCATGVAGFVRNLAVEEIVGQIYAARFEFKRPVDNVVFMGMGEPLDNFDNVMQAIRVMGDQRGFDIAQRRITVSTAGHVEGLLKLAALSLPRIRVAVSINAAEDSLRDSIMPINKKYPLGILKEALAALPLGKDSVIFIEYVLLAGINDSPELADTLADYLQGLRVRVNVIAYNQCGSLPFKTPSPLCVRLFCNRLVAKKLFVRIRQSRGFGIEAACGQLSAALPAPLP